LKKEFPITKKNKKKKKKNNKAEAEEEEEEGKRGRTKYQLRNEKKKAQEGIA